MTVGDDMILRKAVLMIHGFAGGTYDHENLANYLQLNKNFDIFQFTLPGHDRNLSKVTYQQWIDKSEEQVEWLIKQGYNKIYLIGHSMGGVIATYLASKYKEVKKLVLAAPAFHYLNVIKDDLNITESIKITPKIIKMYGKDEIVGRLLKLYPNAVVEFMKLIKEYYDYPKDITCPTLLIHGKDDNLVPISSSEYVYESIKSNIKKLVLVESATHDIFKSEKTERINEIIEKFLKISTKGGIYNI